MKTRAASTKMMAHRFGLALIKNRLKRAALYVARVDSLGALVGFVFEYASVLIPFRRVAENQWALCFPHPVPIGETHLLIVPKRRLATIMLMRDLENQVIFDGVLDCIETALLSREGEFRVVANCGVRQEVKQLHFHVFPSSGLDSQRSQGRQVQWSRVIGRHRFTWAFSDSSGDISFEPAGSGQDTDPDRTVLKEALRILLMEERTLLANLRGFSLSIQVFKDKETPLSWSNHLTLSCDA